MTYEMLLNVTKGYLTGDNALPSDEDVVLQLLNSALTTVATRAESMHLMTLSTTDDVLRAGSGDYLIRKPLLPEDMEDEVDIDEELTFAVARLMASYISREKGGIHAKEAGRVILDYNGSVYELIEKMRLEAIHQGIEDKCTPSMPSTEFTL